jgi:dCTP deaminase
MRGNVKTERSLGELRNHSGKPMIAPFVDRSVKVDDQGNPIISYGLSSYGYDIRLSNRFRLFTKPNDGRVIDPKSSNHDDFSEAVVADTIVIPPGGLLLGHSVETFSIPREVMVVCLGKSTYARCGALVNVTPLEPEWEGELVIEITNGTNLPLKIYAHEGIAQLMFHVGDRECETSYKDRGGKYQGQSGVTLARI